MSMKNIKILVLNHHVFKQRLMGIKTRTKQNYIVYTIRHTVNINTHTNNAYTFTHYNIIKECKNHENNTINYMYLIYLNIYKSL